jgi:hypothetical protein
VGIYAHTVIDLRLSRWQSRDMTLNQRTRVTARLGGAACLSAAALVLGPATVPALIPAASAASDPAAPVSAGGCGGNMPAVPWWSTGVANCSWWGRPGARVTYSWRGAKGDGFNAVQVYGIDERGSSRWYGCGWGASGRCTVPWGNHIAVPKARAMNRVHLDHIYYRVSAG